VGPSVAVSLDGKAKDVALTVVAGAAGAGSVPLLDVFRAAWPSADPSSLRFDLVGSDGFRPLSRSKCTHLLGGDEAKHLRLNVVTQDARGRRGPEAARLLPRARGGLDRGRPMRFRTGRTRWVLKRAGQPG
jgi:hypothetical protein